MEYVIYIKPASKNDLNPCSGAISKINENNSNNCFERISRRKTLSDCLIYTFPHSIVIFLGALLAKNEVGLGKRDFSSQKQLTVLSIFPFIC